MRNPRFRLLLVFLCLLVSLVLPVWAKCRDQYGRYYDDKFPYVYHCVDAREVGKCIECGYRISSTGYLVIIGVPVAVVFAVLCFLVCYYWMKCLQEEKPGKYSFIQSEYTAE